MNKIFREYCEQAKRYFEIQERIGGLRNAPYSKKEIKDSLDAYFEAKERRVDEIFKLTASKLIGARDVGRNFHLPLNRGALKQIPGAQYETIDAEVFQGFFAKELKARLLAEVEKAEAGFGPSIPERESEIAALEEEAAGIREETSFSILKIGRSKWWPHDRLTEDGCDRWLIEAGGPATKAGDIETCAEWYKSNKGLFGKIVDAVKGAV